VSEGDDGIVKRIPLKGTRGTIARRMLESATTKPQVTLHARADVERLFALWDARRAAWEGTADTAVGLNAVVSRVVALAAARDPRLNGTVSDGVVALYRGVHLGVAVAIDGGLIVPVVRDADRLTVPELARALAAMADRARARRLTVDDVSGGTLTVSNLGMYGVETFTPLVNPPEIAIIGLGAVRPEPVVRHGTVAVARLLPLSVTFDHAAIDGAQVAEWLQLLVRMLEAPDDVLKDDGT
jgi:pyruvate dehydrogenase E2 component (dihydrolipoamide acetyltransferase)